MDGDVLQITRFRNRTRWLPFDAALREAIPAYRSQDGLVAAWFGRRGPDFDDERAIAAVWRWPASEQARHRLPDMLGEELTGGIEDLTREIRPVVLYEVFARTAPASILRIYEGQTRPGELDAYVAEARAGVLLDGANADGPVCVTMSLEPPDRFVTVSTWTDWTCLERCTGGDRDRPLVTRNAARLIGGGPRHYELLPEADGAAHPA
jgi:hypothetical protein